MMQEHDNTCSSSALLRIFIMWMNQAKIEDKQVSQAEQGGRRDSHDDAEEGRERKERRADTTRTLSNTLIMRITQETIEFKEVHQANEDEDEDEDDDDGGDDMRKMHSFKKFFLS